MTDRRTIVPSNMKLSFNYAWKKRVRLPCRGARWLGGDLRYNVHVLTSSLLITC